MSLRSLASNPNSHTLDDIAERIAAGHTTTDELATLLPRDVVAAIPALAAVTPLPESPVDPLPSDPHRWGCRADDFTLVYLWGIRGAGKTTLVSSLLAARTDITLCTPQTSPRHQRMARLTATPPGSPGLCVIPHDSSTRSVHTTHLVVNARHLGRHSRHPMTLVEVDIDETSQPWGYMMAAPNEKIHLFCIDASADVDRQARLLDRLLSRLDTDGVLRTSVGLYVVVTKTDTMLRVPRPYRDKAAQTLVTAGQQHFWRHVEGLCFDMGILDATPIAFSAGHVTLQRILRPDTTTARRLWQRPLLLKSLSVGSTTRRLLNAGDLPLTLFALALIISITAGAIISAVSINDPCPQEHISPVNTASAMQRHISNTLHTTTAYNDATKAFNTLDAELNLAHTTRRRDQQPLLDDNAYAHCRNTLDSLYAPIINDALDNLFAQPDWSTHHDFHTLDSLSLGLYRRSDTARAAVYDNRQHLKTYFETIAPTLKVTDYRELSQVIHADSVYDAYATHYPYNNLNDLRELSRRAHNSYTDYLDTQRPPNYFFSPFRYLFDNTSYQRYEEAHQAYLDYKESRNR